MPVTKEKPSIVTREPDTWVPGMRLDNMSRVHNPGDVVVDSLNQMHGWEPALNYHSGPVTMDPEGRHTIAMVLMHLASIGALQPENRKLAELCWAQYYLALLHASSWCEGRQKSSPYTDGRRYYHAEIPVYRIQFHGVMYNECPFDLAFRRQRVLLEYQTDAQAAVGMYPVVEADKKEMLQISFINEEYRGSLVAQSHLFNDPGEFFRTSYERPWVGVHT